MARYRNAALFAVMMLVTLMGILLMVSILVFFLPISASEALNGRPKGAHSLGFWLFLLVSLPFWLAGMWLSLRAIIQQRHGQGHKFRRFLWASAIFFSVLAGASLTNVFGFGDLLSPSRPFDPT